MKKIILLILSLLFTCHISWSGNFLPLTDKKYKLFEDSFLNTIEYYRDSTKRMTLSEVVNMRFDNINKYVSGPYNENSIYWFRVCLINKSSEKSWYFEGLDPHIQDIKVYQVTGADTISFAPTGSESEFSTRLYNHKNFVYPITFYTSDTTWLYFSHKNNYHTGLSVSLRPEKQFINYALNEYYLLGIFYGILLIMAVYNFFLFFSTRERVYLFYVAYVLFYCLNAFREDGLGFQFIWPYAPQINPWVDLFSPLLLIISFAFYSKSFLSLKNYAQKYDRWINVCIIMYCLLFVLNNFFFTIPGMQYFYLFPFALIYMAGISVWKKGNRSAKYFLLAFSFLVLCFTIWVLRITGMVSTTIYTVYALNFGFLIEVVLFSYALGQRLKIEKEEKAITDEKLILQLKENEKLKDSINKELEIKVEHRTQELAQALEILKEKSKKIEELNQLLEKDNLSLNQDIKDITKARLMLKDLTFEEFKKVYPVEDVCLKYLAEIKWTKGYCCKKCENTTSSEGKTPYSKRCTKCGYDESVTSYTLFHKSKLPITTNFYLVYLILANKNISTHELAEKLGLRQKTCWAFKKKVMEAIENSSSPKLTSREWGRIFYN